MSKSDRELLLEHEFDPKLVAEWNNERCEQEWEAYLLDMVMPEELKEW